MRLTGKRWSATEGACYGFQSVSKHVTLQRFNASTLQRFNASTLQRFNASTLQRFIRGSRSAALIGVASLSIAACGSGGGESTDPDRKSLLDQREKRLEEREKTVSQTETQQKTKAAELTRRETAVEGQETDPTRKATLDTRERQLNTRSTALDARERELNQKEQSTATDFGGFNVAEIVNISNMVKEAADTNPHIGVSSEGKAPSDQTRLTPLRIVHLTPSVNQSDKVVYAFELYSVGGASTSTTYMSYSNLVTSYDRFVRFGRNIYMATNLDVGLGDKFDAQILKAEFNTSSSGRNNTKMHIEVVTDYASDNTSNWLAYGYWLQVPKLEPFKYSDYNLGAFARKSTTYNAVANDVTGKATYKGGLLGLHTSLENNNVKLSRLTGKATITIDFKDAATPGNTEGTFNELKLDGQSVSGQLGFSHNDVGAAFLGSDLSGTIGGNSYRGGLMMTFSGPKPNSATQPTGMQGVAKAQTDNDANSFIAGFGAKKTE